MQGILPASFPACRRTPPTGKRKENWELWFCGYIYIKPLFYYYYLTGYCIIKKETEVDTFWHNKNVPTNDIIINKLYYIFYIVKQ